MITKEARPLVTLVLPAFNEEAILEENIRTLLAHLEELGTRYRWEVLIVNDGSIDKTGHIAEGLATTNPTLKVIHHTANLGVGQALKTGFAQSKGDYIITMDLDLSYSPDHIGLLLDAIEKTRAKVVVASPYVKGGKTTKVPFLRRILSVGANRFLSLLAHAQLSTLTSMVRAYDGRFIRTLNLRANGMEIMPETIYKSMIMRARIAQVPAHLDWSRQVDQGVTRKSSMRLVPHLIATILAGFLFRPFIFFVLPGLLLLGFSLYVNYWMFVHFFEAYFLLSKLGPVDPTAAVAIAYQKFPHTFIVGLLSLMLAIQLISLGILAMQSKVYFEEIFHLGSSMAKNAHSDAGPSR